MKKKLISSFFLLSLILLVACDSDKSEGYGKLRIDLKGDTSYPTTKGTETNASYITPYEDINNYTVEMSKEGGETQSALYSAMKLTNEIEAGTYTIRAFYGDNVSAGYEKLYVEGSQTLTIGEGETKTVSFVCVPANTKVKVQYSEDFFDYYSDECTVGLKTQHLTESFNIAKADIDKDLYLKSVAEGETLTITFDLKDKDGNSVTPKGFGAQTAQIKPRDFLTITVKPNIIEVDGGTINGITVITDDGVTEENVNVVIPNDFL